jgi:hypothetical protein
MLIMIDRSVNCSTNLSHHLKQLLRLTASATKTHIPSLNMDDVRLVGFFVTASKAQPQGHLVHSFGRPVCVRRRLESLHAQAPAPRINVGYEDGVWQGGHTVRTATR